MKNFRDSGKSLVNKSAGVKVSGVPVVVGDRVGIPAASVPANTEVVIMLEGSYDVAKTAGEAWAQGITLYWDDAGKACTTSHNNNANKKIGSAGEAAVAADTAGVVILAG